MYKKLVYSTKIIIKACGIEWFWKKKENSSASVNKLSPLTEMHIHLQNHWNDIINAFVAYGGWVPRKMGDWNYWPQTQTPRSENPRARPTSNLATSPARHAERTSEISMMGQPGATGARGQRHSPQGTRPEAPNLTYKKAGPLSVRSTDRRSG